MRSPILLAVALLAVAGCSATTVPPPRTGDAAADPAALDAAAQAALAASCAPCHARSGAPPWYGRIAPSSWLSSARDVLDVDALRTEDPARRAADLRALAAAVEDGSMPPGDYTLFDRGARLSDDARQALVRWAEQGAARAMP